VQKIVAAVLSVLLIAPTGVWAQGSFSRIRNPRQSAGPLQEAGLREATRLAATLSVASQQQTPQQRSWAGRHPVLLGALIGMGTGVTIAAVQPRCGDGLDEYAARLDCSYALMTRTQGAVLGAAALGTFGALIGLAVAASR
jgi:hypothetical protein